MKPRDSSPSTPVVDAAAGALHAGEGAAGGASAAIDDARFLAMADNIPGAIFHYLLRADGSDAVEYISRGCQEILEVEPHEVRADATRLWQLIDERDRPAMEASIAHSAQSLDAWHHQWQITTPSGKCKYLEGTGRPQRMANGDVRWDSFVLDVTARAQAEYAREISEARLRTLIDAAPEAVVVLDLQANCFVDCNLKAATWFGLSPDALRAIGPLELSPEFQSDGRRSTDAAAAHLQLAVDGGEPVFEWMHRASDGRELPCEVHLVRLPDAERVLIRGSMIDLTRRRSDADALRHSQTRLSLLFENMADGLYILDADWRIVTINPSAARMLGVDAEAVLHCRLYEVFDDLPGSAWEDAMQWVVANGNSRSIEGYYEPHRCWYETRIQPLQAGLAVFFSDISLRKRAEQAIRESEQRFRSLLENIESIAVQGYDAQRRITFWNRASEMLYGYTAAEAIGRTLEETIIPPELRTLAAADVDRWIADGKVSVHSEQLELMHRDGHMVPVFSSHVMQTSNPGQPELYCLDIDMRDLRRTEAQLQRSNDALRQRNLELQQFVMVASHDLQEPLRKLQTFGDRLQETLGDRLHDSERDYLDRMINAAERMRALIEDLLGYSALTAQHSQRTAVDLGEVVRVVLEDLEAQIAKTGATVTIGSLPTISGDPVQMRQLLQNLIGNALKYHAAEQTPQITVESTPVASTAGVMHRIRIADNGIGFDDRYRERIFAPFQRLHARSEYSGNGIGLAIARKVCEQHGGSIAAHGVPGEGAEFVIVLPERS
jgi:PAS domain S-box-containing protein